MFEWQTWMHRQGEYPQNDREWFELLARAVFSCGLGPRVVRERWPAMTTAFYDWEPAMVARMTQRDMDLLLANREIIRNRLKIETTVENARRFMDATECSFGELVADLVTYKGFEEAGADLSNMFARLGHTSALLFLFSAGYRPDKEPDNSADTTEQKPAPVAAPGPDIDPDIADLRKPLDVLTEAVQVAVQAHADDGEVTRRYGDGSVVLMLDMRGGHYHVNVSKIYRKEVR
jgi:3-methyladenine DNA glycosylase Tag